MSTTPEIKRLLAAAWPGVVFDYGTAGRGRAKGLSVGWTGGPSLESVASTPGCQRTGTRSHTRVAVHFVRRPSPEEHAADIGFYRQVTYESPAAKQRREFAESRQMRPARRLARSKARAEAVARGIARRAAGNDPAVMWRLDLHPPGQAWLLNPEAWPVFRRVPEGVHAL